MALTDLISVMEQKRFTLELDNRIIIIEYQLLHGIMKYNKFHTPFPPMNPTAYITIILIQGFQQKIFYNRETMP